jgi:hypothetical protein
MDDALSCPNGQRAEREDAAVRFGAVGAAFVLAAAGLVAAPVAAAPTQQTYLPFVPSWCERTDAGYRCMAGPVRVPADEEVHILSGVAAPSETGYITSGRAILVDRTGERIDHHRVHFHHGVWLNPHERDMTCDSYDERLPGYERFFATGKEATRFTLPSGHGYHWDNRLGQPYTQSAPYWILIAHLDGMHGHAETYIRFDLSFVSQSSADDMTAITPVWLDVRNCTSDPVYTVEKGSGRGGVHRERWTYDMPVGGRFVFLGGHLHDGGLRLVLDNVTRRNPLYVSKALYGKPREPWNLTGMTTYSGRAGKQVSAGDRLRLTAVYDSSRRWEDVMGIMVGALVPD